MSLRVIIRSTTKTCTGSNSFSQRGLVPVEQHLHSIFDFDLVGPAEAVEFSHVDKLARCSVRLGRVEHDLTAKAHSFHHKFAQLSDSQFFTRTDIYMAIADFTQ